MLLTFLPYVAIATFPVWPVLFIIAMWMMLRNDEENTALGWQVGIASLSLLMMIVPAYQDCFV